jgi:hypothetical protein
MVSGAMRRVNTYQALIASSRKLRDETYVSMNEDYVEQSVEEVEILQSILKYLQKSAYLR